MLRRQLLRRRLKITPRPPLTTYSRTTSLLQHAPQHRNQPPAQVICHLLAWICYKQWTQVSFRRYWISSSLIMRWRVVGVEIILSILMAVWPLTVHYQAPRSTPTPTWQQSEAAVTNCNTQLAVLLNKERKANSEEQLCSKVISNKGITWALVLKQWVLHSTNTN